MALLQVRNFPDETYTVISEMAKAERRTIAQQTILLIENGLSQRVVPAERRRRAIERTMGRTAPEGMRGIDFAAMIREDRER